jgi:hypothetical protein
MNHHASLIIAATLITLLVGCSKPSNKLTAQESVALTNAVRMLTTNQIVNIGFSHEDNRAFVTIRYDAGNPAQNQSPVAKDGFIFTHTYDHGSVFSDGFMFELTKTGWNYLPIPSNETKRK